MAQRYLLLLADKDPIDPFAEWIDSMPWDGQSRLPAIVATLTPAEDYPADMAKVLIEKWLLSIVAATYIRKGFRSRGVLTLQGGQGIGKTTWISNLVTPPDLREDVVKLGYSWDGGSKDAKLDALHHRIVELGELEGSFRREIAGLKAFLTQTVDKIRPPYARRESEYPKPTNPQSKEANNALRGLLGPHLRVRGRNLWYIPWRKHDPNGTEYFDDPEAQIY